MQHCFRELSIGRIKGFIICFTLRVPQYLGFVVLLARKKHWKVEQGKIETAYK